MDTNIAAWMIAGGPRIEIRATERDRAQLHAYRESQRVAHADDPSLIDRVRSLLSRPSTNADVACCPA
jgi:hypothetical protein